MRRSQWWPALAGLAEEQAGMFTTAQAAKIGASRPQLVELANEGSLERIQHGVYQFSGSPVDRWVQTRAAWLSLAPSRTLAERLAGDPQGIISHRTAALVLDLGDLDADRIEITVEARRRTRNPNVLIHRGHVDRGHWYVHEGLPITTPTWTVATLAITGLDTGHLASVARDAMIRHDVPSRQLAAALEPAAARYLRSSGSELLDDLLQEAGAPVSAVDVVVAAASSRLAAGIVANSRMTELVHRINAQLTSTPSWQQMVRGLMESGLSHETASQALEPVRQQLTLMMVADEDTRPRNDR